MSIVLIKEYAAPAVDLRAILRYAGVRDDAPDMIALANDCFAEAKSQLTYRVCYAEFPLAFGGEGLLDFGFGRVCSTSLSKHLMGCGSVVVLAATIGLAFDRLIARYSARIPSRAVMLDAVGIERVEALCDTFCQDIEGQTGKEITARFSPGYGDLPLTFQREIFRALDVPRRIGISLNESLLMSPSKSVTAIVGIKA